MPNTQQNWMNTNASRQYPVDDAASGTTDSGKQLPADLIVDLHLRWPAAKGQYAFVSGITITRNIVTAVILAAESMTATGDFIPLASITLRQPVAEYAMHSLTPLTDGVGGFIAFGDVSEDWSLRFATASQSMLGPRVARPYGELPVSSIRKLGRVDGLTDIVNLRGENDVEVVKATRIIDGQLRDAIVIRLKSQTATRNPLAIYTGPCGSRPESNTCEQPGIQSINGIIPDCNGNIDIDFKALTAVGYHECGGQFAGVTLDQPLTLADVCPVRKPVRFNGKDYCNGGASLSLPFYGEPPGTGGGDPVIPPIGSSNSVVVCRELPFQDCFDSVIDAAWVTKIGAFQLVDSDPSPEYPCPVESCPPAATSKIFEDVFDDVNGDDIWNGVFSTDAAVAAQVFHDVFDDVNGDDVWNGVFSYATTPGPSLSCTEVFIQSIQLNDIAKRNIVVWEDCATGSTLGKKITTQLQLIDTSPQHNAGIVLNHRTVDPYTNPRVNFMVAQIDKDTNQLQLSRFNGTTMILENAVTPAIPFLFDDWFEMQVTVTSTAGAALISITVRNVTAPTWPAVTLNLLTSLWGSTDGYFGVHTLKSIANFGFWRIEDA